MVAAIGGWLLALFFALTTYLERRTQQKHGVLLKALEYLTGGSQNRSIGIALIEGLWSKKHPFAESLLPALTNQSIYLLLETESRSGRHQFHNWLRIMNLMMKVPYREQHFMYYAEILNAVDIRIDEPTRSRGVEISEETAKTWRRRVSEHANLGSVA